jgi:hypothetical protein
VLSLRSLPSERRKVKPFECEALFVQEQPTVVGSMHNAIAVRRILENSGQRQDFLLTTTGGM